MPGTAYSSNGDSDNDKYHSDDDDDVVLFTVDDGGVEGDANEGDVNNDIIDVTCLQTHPDSWPLYQEARRDSVGDSGRP